MSNRRLTKWMVITGGIFLVLLLVIFQPWHTRKIVLNAEISDESVSIQLAERPYWFWGVTTEYHTWLGIKRKTGETTWHTIDRQYITLTHVYVLYSAGEKLIRVETTPLGTQAPAKGSSHMIAEYDLKNGKFSAKSGPTVRGIKGWVMLADKKVR